MNTNNRVETKNHPKPAIDDINQPEDEYKGHRLNLNKYKQNRNSTSVPPIVISDANTTINDDNLITRSAIYQKIQNAKNRIPDPNTDLNPKPGLFDRRISRYIQNNPEFTEELFNKEQEIRELKQISKDINSYTHNFKTSWRYLALVFWELFIIIFRMMLIVLSFLFKIISLVLLYTLRLTVMVFLAVYFFITLWLPTRRGSPFRNIMTYERMRRRDLMFRNERVLFLDLDNTLVFVTPHKPLNCKYIGLKVKSAGGEAFEKFYLVKRPFLDEFLIEVS